MSGHFELTACTATLLREIALPEMKRRDVAKTYALAMRSSDPTDWGAVNRAIIARWSVSALNWIKEQAHSGKCWGEKP
jgi:hypothetical protein